MNTTNQTLVQLAAAGTKSAAAASAEKDKDKVQPTTPDDMARLPLLQPFQIQNPSTSNVVTTLMNEQTTADTLAALIKKEEKLRSELQKAKGGDDDKDGKKGGKAKKGKSKASSSANAAKIKELEQQIDTMQLTLHQIRQNLTQYCNWTVGMLQGEYSKLAVTLDPESERYADLEEAISFLCPRVKTEEGDSYDHDQRLAYVRETLPVLKKIKSDVPPSALVEFPYLKKFQCDDPASPIISALMDEMHQLQITEQIRTRLEKTKDASRLRVLKHAEDQLDTREVATSELVRKFYRKKSIKLHPDRNGERMRPTFEAFTDARTVLSDVKLRQSYLRGMLDVYGYNPALIEQSHEAWERKHRPDKVDARPSVSESKGTLKLEGGFTHQVPRGVMIHHKREGNKYMVTLSVHVLRPVHEFYGRVRSVRVVLRNFDDVHVIKMDRSQIVKRIRFDRTVSIFDYVCRMRALQDLTNISTRIIENLQGPIFDNMIEVATNLAVRPGNWEVSWTATLDSVSADPLSPTNATSDSLETRESSASNFYVVDRVAEKKRESLERCVSDAIKAHEELRATIAKLRGNMGELTEARYGQYHQILVKSRKKLSNLSRAMIDVGETKNKWFDNLNRALIEGRSVYGDIEARAEGMRKRRERKDNTKLFKAYIASVLESDDPVSWMRTVDAETLRREGGDANRLYQLFIEGKGKYVLLVDSDMYGQASLRGDFFSAKQCKDLSTRGKAVALQEAKEEEEAREAEARQKKEEEEREKMRREAELRNKWACVGNNATIKGLTSEKGSLLNRKMCRIQYYNVDKDRFEVELYGSEEKAYLKEENLTLFYGLVPDQPKPPLDGGANGAGNPPPAQTSASDFEERGMTPDGRTYAIPPPTARPQAASAAGTHKTMHSPSTPASQQSTQPPTKEADFPVLPARNAHSDSSGPNPPLPKPVVASLPKPAPRPTPPAKASPLPKVSSNGTSPNVTTKTVFVKSPHYKKLTGKRGRKKKDLVARSGSEIDIESQVMGGYVQVHLRGTAAAINKGIEMIEEAIGDENVSLDHQVRASPGASPGAVAAKEAESSQDDKAAAAHRPPPPTATVAETPSPAAPSEITPPPAGKPPGMPSPEKRRAPAPAEAQGILPPAAPTQEQTHAQRQREWQQEQQHQQQQWQRQQQQQQTTTTTTSATTAAAEAAA
ncbi:hypothetical protein THAOC_02224 [Thalassiosira oceanica]|uniref:J domain-containing protein n=2 Tax=Thalassiosira oceanica TaxID=159749 RepID=K0TB76_THAOC|nr:hypothetical protein THAOC_02224 [Thalassiosira oceanica]|eukprot:EJK76033.1 hypothetical protein THAOC_02224 [Thalassiosira oceanica]